MDSSAGATMRKVGRLCQAMALIMALFVGEQALERVARALHIHPTAGTLGMQGVATSHGGAGAVRIVRILPGGAGATAGLRPGDVIVPDHAVQMGSAVSTRVRVGFTVVRANQERHLTIRPAPLRGPADWSDATLAVALLVYLASGALLALSW